MNDYEIDANAIISQTRKALQDLHQQPGMTARNISAFTGVHFSSLSRFKDGKTITAENFLKLWLWAKDQAPPLDLADR